MPDNGIALERREAQGSSQEPARPGTPIPLKTLGSRNLGALTSADRKAGEGSLASSLAPPGAPSPREREKEKRDAGHPRARTTKNRGGGALASMPDSWTGGLFLHLIYRQDIYANDIDNSRL